MATRITKSHVVTVRFSDEQYEPLREPIACSGHKPARYMRDLILSRSPTLSRTTPEHVRLQTVFEKAGHALNQVAYLANSAPYRERLYLSKYLHWLNRLSSIHMLLAVAVSESSSDRAPLNLRKASSGNKGSPKLKLKKNVSVSFRLTAGELAQFEYVIKRAGCSPSDFFRELILNDLPIFREYTGLRKRLIFITNKAGNNVTQLAYISNMAFERGLITADVQLKWLDLLASIEDLLLAGIHHAD